MRKCWRKNSIKWRFSKNYSRLKRTQYFQEQLQDREQDNKLKGTIQGQINWKTQDLMKIFSFLQIKNYLYALNKIFWSHCLKIIEGVRLKKLNQTEKSSLKRLTKKEWRTLRLSNRIDKEIKVLFVDIVSYHRAKKKKVIDKETSKC